MDRHGAKSTVNKLMSKYIPGKSSLSRTHGREESSQIPVGHSDEQPQPSSTTTSGLKAESHKSPRAVVQIPLEQPFGIEPRSDTLLSDLSDANLGIIGITGLGGIGKTTLLKSLNNMLLLRGHNFDIVIFASASFDDREGSLQVAILQRMGLPWRDTQSKMTRSARISVALEQKRFLLLLDGICDPIDLDELGVPPLNAENNSKVVLATRSPKVCEEMGAHKVLEVEPLTPPAAWQMFTRCAGEVASLPETIDVAKSVASECGGIPLGLMTVGRAMAKTRTRSEWDRSLEALRRSKKESNDRGDLKFCYEKLSSQKLRDCLSYCALYPKNYSIRREELICYWFGEGLLNDSSGGESLIDELKRVGLLKDGVDPEKEVTMHDLVRDFVLQIKKKEFISQAGGLITTIPNSESFQAAEKVSLMCNDITALDRFPRCGNLTTLNLRSNSRLRTLPDDLFKKTPYLRLLDLSNTTISEVPKGISTLTQLRHLNLSHTRIKSLPVEIGKLGNLIHLILEGTTSLVIPAGLLSKFANMVLLNFFRSFGNWDIEGTGSTVHIEELESMQQMSDLGITIRSISAWEKFSNSAKLDSSVTRMLVNYCGELLSVHLSSKFKKLREVYISDCLNLEELRIGDADGRNEKDEGKNWQLSQLEILRLKALYKAKIVWAGVLTPNCLPRLRQIDISFCHELKDVTWVLQLPCIEIVKLDTCKEIKQVISGEQGSSSNPPHLPSLRSVELCNLPKLMGLWEQLLSFPSLDYVKVTQCPQLRILPQTSVGTIISGEKEWWNALQWKAGSGKHRSFWCFQAVE